MSPQDIQYAQSVLSAFIGSAINRVSVSGDLAYNFRLTAGEIKTATNRQRLHDSVIQDYVDFFTGHNVGAEYDDSLATFSVQLDLNRCVLSAKEAEFLSVAMETYRANYG